MTYDIAKIDNYSVYRRLGNNIFIYLLYIFMFSFILFRRDINYLFSKLLNLGNQIYYPELSTVMMYMSICLNISI